MKLTRLIKNLQEYLDQADAGTDVLFSTGPSTSLDVMSIYPDDNKDLIWVDIGDDEEEG